MKTKEEKIIYGTYYRKSSEANDKQAQSIPDQIRDTEIVALKEKLIVGKKFPGESQSAFDIGRPIFADLVKNIVEGKINAILVWHPNRLARNPVDAGMILYLMDEGKLKVIRTPSRIYLNTSSDKFMLQLEFGMSKKDSDDKSEVVKRALEGRAIRGLPSGVSKVGFLNDTTEEKGNRKWIVDKIRFPLIEKLFRKMLTGKYSPAQIYRYTRDDLKLTTVQRKKVGGKRIAYSYIYVLLRDPLYAGFFFHNGKRCELDKRLPRAISEEEYWKIQSMLGLKGRPQPSKHQGIYNEFLTCEKCKGRMSPDFKFQMICSVCKNKFAYRNTSKCPKCKTNIEQMIDPTYCSYVYYYCINNKKHRTICLGNGIEEKEIEKAIYNKFTTEICISKELSDWCLKNLSIIKDKEIQDESNIGAFLENQELQIKRKLNNLLSYRIKQQDLTQEQTEIFDIQEKELQKEWSDIKQRKNVTIDWYSEASKEFSLMTELDDILKNGNPLEKKEVLFELRSNLSIKEKNISISNRKSIDVFANSILRAKSENPSFEPKNFVFAYTNKHQKTQTGLLPPMFLTLLRRQGSNL